MAHEIAKQQPFHRSCLGPKKKGKVLGENWYKEKGPKDRQ